MQDSGSVMWKAKLLVYVILLLFALVPNGRGDTSLTEELSHDMEQLESYGGKAVMLPLVTPEKYFKQVFILLVSLFLLN